MKTYETYKASDLPWIKSFPYHWKNIRNGALFDYHQDKVGSAFAEYDLLSLTTQGVRRKDINDVTGKVPASYSGYQEVKNGDMIFCLFDLDCSAVFSGLSHHSGMITSAYDVATPIITKVNPRYMEYWFQSVFAGRYYKIFSKSVRYTINWDVFKAIKSPVPPRPEQDQIVRYLDWKVSCINRLIHGYQRQIELCRERKRLLISQAILGGLSERKTTQDSGVEWIGEIPCDWETIRCKNLFTETNERSADGTETHLSMSQKLGLVPDDVMTERRLLSESYVGGKICYKNDLVLNRLKAHLGVFALAKQKGVISPDYTVFKINTDLILPEYAEMVLKSDACRGELVKRVRGITVGFWRLYTENFNTIVLPVPSIDEQEAIMNHLNGRFSKIDSTIDMLGKEMSLLREYRTRLISDVVTGQIDVRDEVIPDYTPETDTEDEDAATAESEVD